MMIVVRLDRRPRAIRSDSESLRPSRPWQMSMVQRVETAWTAAATVFITAARIAATTSPCPAAPSGFCRPKRSSINRRPLASGGRADIARRAEFHHRRQARQDEYRRQEQQQQAAHDRAQTSHPIRFAPPGSAEATSGLTAEFQTPIVRANATMPIQGSTSWCDDRNSEVRAGEFASQTLASPPASWVATTANTVPPTATTRNCTAPPQAPAIEPPITPASDESTAIAATQTKKTQGMPLAGAQRHVETRFRQHPSTDI